MHPLSNLASTALLASSFVAGLAMPQLTASAAAAPPAELTWCDATPAPPCISSATHNGADITTLANWDVSGSVYTVGGSSEIAVNLMYNDGSGWDHELGATSLDDDVVVTLKTGSLTPRVVSGKGRDTAVARAGSGSAHEVSVSGTPVIVSGQCDQSAWPWVCPAFSGTGDDPEEWIGILNFTVSDYGAWDDVAQRNSFYGMNYFNNVAATSIPPEIVESAATGDPMLLIRLANRHYLSDGKTPVKGRGELRIPNAFLEEVYGIPDPATMTGSSLLPSLSGAGSGTVTSAQEAGDAAMLVTYDDVEFSTRKLRIATGVITPTRVKAVETMRVGPRKGNISFLRAKPRGAEVTGYKGRCVSKGGHAVVVTTDEWSTPVPGLRRGTAYSCRGRALSEAGPGRWSPAEPMAAKPPVT